jgi:probable rRNA maturation factor
LLQADDFGHSPERELVYLFVHSMFHLLGLNHEQEDEKKDMRQLEESVMEQLGLKREELS